MTTKPFLKWAGGKRWLVDRPEFALPAYNGRYLEPFLGGGAVFFSHRPSSSTLSDLNSRLITTYAAIKDDWELVWGVLHSHQRNHSREYYYQERNKSYREIHHQAAQFIYLNRACWNGLYRENLNGVFNVPIGTKSKIIFESDNFAHISELLQTADIVCSDFEPVVDSAKEGDFVFVDPPYTTAHNLNGFVKYNQNIFSWDDQVRLRDALIRAKLRGATICITNADHDSIKSLYSASASYTPVPRHSIISGSTYARKATTEAVIYL